jgi:hypothetical protein
VIAIAAPAGGTNRVLGVAVPFALSAIALAVSALASRRVGWLGGALLAAATLAILYGGLLAVSLPLRLAVEATCPPAQSSCPLGFDRPATAGENFAVYAAAIGGATALVLTFVAVEARYLRKPRPKQHPRNAPLP